MEEKLENQDNQDSQESQEPQAPQESQVNVESEAQIVETEAATKKKKINFAFELYDWAHSLVFAFVGFVLVLSFAFGIFSIDQTSMTDTLQPGEMVIVSRLPYTPKTGDIVLFVKHGWAGSYNENTGLYNPLIKRVIGVPGDELTFDAGTVFINGEPLDEPYIKGEMQRWADERLMVEGKVVVPEDSIFVMGDNRNGSFDSRNTDIGFVDTRSLLGHALLRVTPFSKFGRI